MLQSYGLAPGPLLEIAIAFCVAGCDTVDPGYMVDGAGSQACGCGSWIPTLHLWSLDMTAHLFSV